MQIAHQHVVRFHYQVGEPGQPTLESSFEGEPVTVLIGHGSVIPGLERALIGRRAGDRFEIAVAPADAYGERREDLTQRIPRKHFGAARLQSGQQVRLDTRFGPRMVTVQKVGMSVVDVDLNHPMAGKALHFEVEIVEVRAASAEEIAHGHVHGEGGHHHD